MKAKYIKSLIVFILVVIAIVFTQIQSKKELKSNSVSLSKCTDGDTAHFFIDGKDVTVRFLAIDTPETVKRGTAVQPYGKEASEYTCNALKGAKEIHLEFENEKTDKYGRMLAWVFIDDELLQEKLIKKGYAKVAYLYGNYKYTGLLQKEEKSAKKGGIGLWK